ncbi:MAG: DUF4149 domain-containing protein [Anaerolineales bacterium]|nr:DUF4149 domain-containing protein [Anaerolineales bacterium]
MSSLLYVITRWVHVISGAAWFGLVGAIVFVIFPVLSRMSTSQRNRLMGLVFPRIFRLATILVSLTLAAGALLNYLLTGWRSLGMYFSSPRWFALFLGAALGLALGTFHFLVEPRLENKIHSLVESEDEDQIEQVSHFLKIVPRVGFCILMIVILFMMVFSRGTGQAGI